MLLQKRFGQIGMFGAVWFFLNQVAQDLYNLLPPRPSEAMFFTANSCLLLLLIGLWQNRVSGERWYGRFPLGLFIFGWACITLGGFIAIFTGNSEIILFPVGGAGMLFGSLLTGIATAVFGRWRDWKRYAPLFLGLVNPVSMLVRGEFEPNLLVMGLWMAAWFLVGLALHQEINSASYSSIHEGEFA